MCRVAHSWIRFGSFQLPASLEEKGFVKQLADYVIKHHYSSLEGADTACWCAPKPCAKSCKLFLSWAPTVELLSRKLAAGSCSDSSTLSWQSTTLTYMPLSSCRPLCIMSPFAKQLSYQSLPVTTAYADVWHLQDMHLQSFPCLQALCQQQIAS